MGIVLGHILAASYFSYRDENWFNNNNARVEQAALNPDLRSDWDHHPATPRNKKQDVDPAIRKRLLRELQQSLEVAADISELKTALEGVVADLPSLTTKICIYFKGISINEGTDGIFHDSIVREALKQKEQIISLPTDSNHPQFLSVSEEATWETSNSVIVCSPILGPVESEVFGIVIAVCDYFSEEQERIIQDIQYQPSATYRRFKSQIMGSDNKRDAAVLQLCADLFDPDATALQLKVIKYLQEQTLSEIAFLLLNDKDNNDLFCQVVGDIILQEEVRIADFKRRLILECKKRLECWGTNSTLLQNENENTFGAALKRKEPITEKDLPNNNMKELEKLLNINIKTFLCVPVMSKADDSLIALVCLVNKMDESGFDADDVHCIEHCFKYTATVLTSTLAYQNERKLKDQTKSLLEVARNLFTHLDDLTKLLHEIMTQARNLTCAERCSVFLIDTETDELVAKVFDGITTDNTEPQSEIRFPRRQGIAGHVATTGELLNIRDAYAHSLFYRGIDENTGFRTRNILCFPIKDEKGCVIGVAQLCNKTTGPCFTSFDEAIASAFAVYCCISISHSLMYNKVIDSQARNNLINELMMYHMKSVMYQTVTLARQRSQLSNELMIYHMQVSPEEARQLSTETVSLSEMMPDFDRFNYAPRWMPEANTCKVVVAMFEDLGFLAKWRIKNDTLIRFILMVKKGYRTPPYHNWIHAFSVAHFAYIMAKNARLHEYLDDLEIFALFVSCLCHDIDHRGTNNSFQVASQSVLAALYSSEGSVMERHHFAQSMCILNTEGCNIFENLPSKDYTRVLDLMRDIILATDLAHHLGILKDIENMVTVGYDKKNRKHHKLLLCLLMTACDLSDQTKCWEVTKHIAGLIYQEFFSQGDLEKALGHKPIEMMDRERAKIPDQQISFLDNIALPVFRVLARMFKECDVCEAAVMANRRRWEAICKVLKDRGRMTIDDVLALEFDANEKIIGLAK